MLLLAWQGSWRAALLVSQGVTQWLHAGGLPLKSFPQFLSCLCTSEMLLQAW